MEDLIHDAPTAERCERTGKRCYESERAARNMMRRLSARLRTYRCEFCRKIHLTKERHLDGRRKKKKRRRG